MRILGTTSPLLYFLAFSTTISRARGVALPSEEQLASLEGNLLVKRQCANSCGFYGQVCCGANEVCSTDENNQAQCVPAGSTATAVAGQGNWQYYTTTYVQTDLRTITTTFSSFFPISTQNFVFSTTASSHCQYSLGESPCGSICCSSGQFCMAENQCAAAGGGSSGFYSSFYTVTQNPSVPVRPTSNTVFTVTATGSATTTVPFQTPVGTDGSTLIGVDGSAQGSGLSGGEIAGIVIGVIAGIILLLLICLCCCGKAAFDALAGIFGGRRDRKRRTEVTETYYGARHSHHGSRPQGRTWFGASPRVDHTEKRRTGGGLSGFAKVGLALGGLAAGLGLKRRLDRRRNDAKSDSSYSYDYGSYITSESSESSDRRTRNSRRSRR